MKWKVSLAVLVFFSAFSLTIGSGSPRQSLNTLSDMQVKPGSIFSTIVLNSKAPLKVTDSSYREGPAPVIEVNLDGVDTSLPSRKSEKASDFVQQIIVEKPEPGKVRLKFEIREKVPYRIYASGDSTVMELNHIQRSMDRYVLGSEIMQVFEKEHPETIRLKDISFKENNGRIDITARLTGSVTPQVFALPNPCRLILDLYGTLNSTPKNSYNINRMGVKLIRAAQFENSDKLKITRLVLDLDEPSFYSLESRPDGLQISFFKNAFAMSSTPAVTVETARASLDAPVQINPPPAESPADRPLPSGHEKSPDKAEEIMADSVVQDSPARIQPEKEASLAKAENSDPGRTEAAAENQQENTPEARQTSSQTVTAEQAGYSGKLVTLRFKDMDLRDVILTLGNIAGLNVVFNPDVRGTVTCDLVDIPWDQAMDILLRENKMGRTIEGNVLRIAPISLLTREQEDERKLMESRELAGPTVTRIFELSYARVSEVNTLLAGKLSERGEIILDARTNTLIITDVKDRMALIERLVEVLDQPTPQVSIEARIVEATSNFIRNLGIQWGTRGVADPFYGNQTSLQFPNKVLVDGALIPQGITTRGIGGPLGGYAINLPAPSFSSAIGFSFGNILDTFRLDMALSALETSGQGRIISSPMITTLNNKQAEIIQGRQIPVQTTANFTVSTRYTNAALELRATPQITAEDTIILELDLQNNAADFANLVNGIPPLITQRANTTMTVPDGGTRVIGGIYRTEDSITNEKVPFLSKIPILGTLFKSSAHTKTNRELLIFITPRIIR